MKAHPLIAPKTVIMARIIPNPQTWIVILSLFWMALIAHIFEPLQYPTWRTTIPVVLFTIGILFWVRVLFVPISLTFGETGIRIGMFHYSYLTIDHLTLSRHQVEIHLRDNGSLRFRVCAKDSYQQWALIQRTYPVKIKHGKVTCLR